MYKSLVLKDKGLHKELKKLAAELDVSITDLVEDFVREGIKRKNGGSRNSSARKDARSPQEHSP